MGFGVGQALAPRYTAFSLYLMVSLIYLLAIFSLVASQNNTRKKLIKYNSLLLITIFLVLHINTIINAIDRMSDRRVIL
ncbi:MAG: hypothetical protein MGG11_23030, partial [Trichodesmium sp. MAG_R03]|nr:hypothetical protein [Trichodesmium sp. MAG_R03]